MSGVLLRLHRDEEGASLVFAAITLFTLAMSILFVFQSGIVSSDRIAMQNAADAAAYSGAQVEANALNAIGQINDGMAYVHYTLLRYTVDSIVYRTLDTFRQHDRFVRTRESYRLLPDTWYYADFVLAAPSPDSAGPQVENRPAPDWVLLGDEQEWQKRWDRVSQNFPDLLDQGKNWLRDLENAGRIVMATTPRMVREHAARVARLNGATHVAVSADLEKAFRFDEAGAGFERPGSDSEAAPGMVSRYEVRDLGPQGPQRLPRWFDKRRGRSSGGVSGGYSQVRLCWSMNDWGHRDQGESHAPDFAQYQRAPNGHWHARHVHWVLIDVGVALIPYPIPHGGITRGQELPTSGGTGGGHMSDDTELHNWPEGYAPFDQHQYRLQHHALQKCPTCYGRSSTSMPYTDVKKTQRDVRDTKTLELKWDDGGIPRPLALKEPLLRSGVTVATWRPGRGVGDWLPASPWGMVAVATAQVGYQTSAGVHLLDAVDANSARYRSGNAGGGGGGPTAWLKDYRESGGGSVTFPGSTRNFTNLYYSSDATQGVRFGARLVAVARELSSHPDLARGEGLDQLIGRRLQRWSSVNDIRDGQTPDALKELSAFFGVKGALEKGIWH